MLPSGSKRAINAYQFAVMLAVTGLGLVGAPWWMAVIAAALLFGSAMVEHAEVHSGPVMPEITAVVGGPVLTVAAMSVAFAGICFSAGAIVGALLFG
jgi:hypothetical protein